MAVVWNLFKNENRCCKKKLCIKFLKNKLYSLTFEYLLIVARPLNIKTVVFI